MPKPNEVSDVTLLSLKKDAGLLIKTVRKRILILLVLSLLGGILGYFAGFLNKPLYTAKVKFVVQEEGKSNSLGSYAGIASQLGIEMPESNSDLFKSENVAELMRSNLIIDKTLYSQISVNGKKELLGNVYLRDNNIIALRPNHQKFVFVPGDFSADRFRDSLLTVIEANLSRTDLQEAKVDNNVTIRFASFTSRSEEFSKIFLENLMKNVGNYYVKTKTERAAQNVLALQKQTDSVKRLLYSSMNSSAISTDYQLNMNPARQIGQVSLQKNKIDLQIQTTTYMELVRNLGLAKLNVLKETPLFQIIDPPRYPLEKKILRKSVTALTGTVLVFFLTLIYFFRRDSKVV